MSFLGAIASFGAQLLGNSISGSQQSHYTKEQQRLQSKLNREEMVQSAGLQRSKDEWSANTLYGKEISSMKNAGMNPAMANGTTPNVAMGSSGATSGSSGPSASMPTMDIIGGMKELDLLDAQKKNIEADTDLKKASAGEAGANTDLIKEQTIYAKWQNNPNVVKLRENGMSLDNLYKYCGSRELNNRAWKNLADAWDSLMHAGVNVQTANNLVQEGFNLKAEYDEIISRIGVNKAEAVAKIINARANMLAAKAAKENSETNKNVFEKRYAQGYYSAETKELYSRANYYISYDDLNEEEKNLLQKKGITEEEYARLLKFQGNLAEYQDKVNQAYGVNDRAGIQFADDVLGLMTGHLPFNMNFSDSKSYFRGYTESTNYSHIYGHNRR